MGGAIETHFKLIDFAKFFLYTSKNKKDIENARFLLKQAKEDQKKLFIKE